MKLYYSPGACSLAVHIALRETGADFEPVKVNLPAHTLADGGNYYDISPRGYVPLLELNDGSRHTEAASLLQYVADLGPSQALIGAAPSARRLAVVEWLSFVATELHKTFSPLWDKTTPEATQKVIKSKLATRFADLDRQLAKNEFLAGDFSVADIYAFVIVNWANVLSIPLSDYPNLKSHQARIAARPQVQAALRAEGLTK